MICGHEFSGVIDALGEAGFRLGCGRQGHRRAEQQCVRQKPVLPIGFLQSMPGAKDIGILGKRYQ